MRGSKWLSERKMKDVADVRPGQLAERSESLIINYNAMTH